jgi:hypothetical protein
MIGIFKNKKDSGHVLKPMGVKLGERPVINTVEKIVIENKPIDRVDKYFMQEISDLLFGPDSEIYISELKKLNNSFRKRDGRSGNQFYDPKYDIERRKKEEIVNRLISE